MEQPKLKIGIMAEAEIKFCLKAEYILTANGLVYIGNQSIRIEDGTIFLNGLAVGEKDLCFEPVNEDIASFELCDVTIGVQFHWERKENQLFKGSLLFLREANKLVAINVLPL